MEFLSGEAGAFEADWSTGEDSGPSKGATVADKPKDTYISAAEIKCAVVVTGIPQVSAEETHAALVDAFSLFGSVQRVVSQGDERKDAGAPDLQHAVIVFGDDASAAAALAYDGSHLFGTPVKVSLASGLSAASDGTGASTDALTSSVEVVSSWLARGITLGRRGATHVQHFSHRHGITDAVSRAVARFRAGAKSTDEKYGISAGVKARASAIDERYAVTDRARAAATSVSSAVSGAAGRAMENQTVRSGVGMVSSAATGIRSVLGDVSSKTAAKLAAEEAAADAKASSEPAAAAEGAGKDDDSGDLGKEGSTGAKHAD
jgi:hypothetical protein